MVLATGVILSFLCGQATCEDSSAVEQDFVAAGKCRRELRHNDAAEIYRRLLRSPTLSQDSRLRARFGLAETLEAIPGRGEQARSAYRDIQNAYPEFPEGIQAAYRLGCLYDSILLPGTSRSPAKAAAQFEYVVQHSSSDTLLHLKARMNLGNLSSEAKEFDKADTHFEVIYDTATALLENQQRGGVSAGDEEHGNERVLSELKYMASRAAVHMAENCMRSDWSQSLAALSALRSRYPSDVRIQALAAQTGRRIVKVFEKDSEGLAADMINGPGFLTVAGQDVLEPATDVSAPEAAAHAVAPPASPDDHDSVGASRVDAVASGQWSTLAVAVAVLAVIVVAACYMWKRRWSRTKRSDRCTMS
jgi:hypothetical protein